MIISITSWFQPHPYHLVSPSPWPINTSFSLLVIAFSAVLIFQGYTKAVDVITLALLGVVWSMSLWFRDIISEGKSLYFTKFLLSLIILFTFIFIILYPTYLEINSLYDFINMIEEPEGKGTIEVNNVSITGLDVAINHIRDGAVYIGGIAAAGKIVKNSFLPMGAKLGATVVMGGVSLIGYKMVQNSVFPNTAQDTISMSADNIKGKGSVSSISKNNFMPDILRFNDVNDSKDKTTYILSSIDAEQLKLDYILQTMVLYLLILVLIILIMKTISDRNLKSNFIEKLPVTD